MATDIEHVLRRGGEDAPHYLAAQALARLDALKFLDPNGRILGTVDAEAEFGASASKTPSYNSGALQDAITKSEELLYPLRLPAGAVRYDTELIASMIGTLWHGGGMGQQTVLTYTGAGGGLLLKPADTDPQLGGPIASDMTFADFKIVGQGSGTSLGGGIETPDGAYAGDFLTLIRVRVHNFAYGFKLTGISQSLLVGSFLSYNGRNIYWLAPGANTLNLVNTSVAHADTVGMEFYGAHQGAVITGGEFAHNPQDIRLSADANGNSPQVEMRGGNFESVTGAEGNIYIGTNAALSHVGQRFLATAGGADIPHYVMEANSRLILGVPRPDAVGTQPVVKKLAGSAQVFAMLPVGALSAPARPTVMEDDGATTHNFTTFPTRLDNQLPAAATGLRGAILQVPSRAGQAEDRVVVLAVRKDGTPEWRDMAPPTPWYALNGGAHGRVDSVRRLSGRDNFNTAAGSYTDVVVTVGAFSQMYDAYATVQTASVHQYTVQCNTWDAVAGTVTFRVFHLTDTGGGAAAQLHYDVAVQA